MKSSHTADTAHRLTHGIFVPRPFAGGVISAASRSPRRDHTKMRTSNSFANIAKVSVRHPIRTHIPATLRGRDGIPSDRRLTWSLYTRGRRRKPVCLCVYLFAMLLRTWTLAHREDTIYAAFRAHTKRHTAPS